MSYFLYNMIVNIEKLIYNRPIDLAEVDLWHPDTQAIREK